MSSELDHIQQAEHNWRFVQSLGPLGSPYSDWIAVGTFYSVLHYVDALIARNHGPDPADHAYRKALLRHLVDGPIFADYSNLHDDSVEARYSCKKFTDAQLQTQVFTRYANVSARIRVRLGI